MEPFKGVLEEQFFLDASDECLRALARLMDDMLAKHLRNYMSDPEAEPSVVSKIEEHLGVAIEKALFHEKFIAAGVVDSVSRLELTTLCYITNVGDELKKFEMLEANRDKVYAFIEPRKKRDWDKFISSVPPSYVPRLLNNSTVFYDPREKPRATGVGILVRKSLECRLAVRGLRYLEHCRPYKFDNLFQYGGF